MYLDLFVDHLTKVCGLVIGKVRQDMQMWARTDLKSSFTSVGTEGAAPSKPIE